MAPTVATTKKTDWGAETTVTSPDNRGWFQRHGGEPAAPQLHTIFEYADPADFDADSASDADYGDALTKLDTRDGGRMTLIHGHQGWLIQISPRTAS